jgi:hypothetical protein
VQLTNQLRTVEAAARPYLQRVLDIGARANCSPWTGSLPGICVLSRVVDPVAGWMTMMGVGPDHGCGYHSPNCRPITAQSDPPLRPSAAWAGLGAGPRQSGRIEIARGLSRQRQCLPAARTSTASFGRQSANTLVGCLRPGALAQNASRNGAILGPPSAQMLQQFS